MVNFNPSSAEIVVGIDFGTTQVLPSLSQFTLVKLTSALHRHSGVSWALNEGQKKIRLITDWPNPSASIANADKVPSIISYKNGRIESWGYEVGLKEEAFRWFKILLEPDSKYARTTQQVRQSNDLLGKINKTAEDVLCDYLKQIWRYTKEDIRKRVSDDDWESNYNVHVVLTVPAMWSHVAKEKTLKAARNAGLPANIQPITEPEAAALATLHDKAEENTLKVCRDSLSRAFSWARRKMRITNLGVLGGRCVCCLRCWRWHCGRYQQNVGDVQQPRCE